MPELVPKKPEKNPAMPILAGVGSNLNGSKLTITANTTNKPNHSDKTLVDTITNKAPTANEPGIRPNSAIFNPPIEIFARCLNALNTEMKRPTRQIGAGT